MSVITLTGSNGKPALDCVSGVEWDTRSKSDWKGRKKSLKGEKQAHIQLPVIKGDANTVNTGTIRRADLGAGKARIALAAWVAYTFKLGTIIAVERVALDDGSEVYWFCAVRDGQVIAGSDAVGDWEDIDLQVTEIVEMIAASDIGFVGAHTANLTANQSGESTPAPLLTMLSKSARKKATLTIPSESNMKTLALAGGLAVALIMAGGTWFYISSDSGNASADARNRQIIKMNRASADYEELLRATAQKAEAGNTIKNLFETRIGGLETQLGGWALQIGECVDNQCALTFTNSDLTDPRILREGTKNVCDTLDISITGIEGVCRFNGAPEPQPTGSSVSLELMDTEGVESLRSGLMKYARNFPGVSYAINPASEVNFSGKRYLKDKNVHHQGSWAMGLPVQQVPYVTELLQRFDALSVSNIKLNWGAKTIEITGLYYKEGES